MTMMMMMMMAESWSQNFSVFSRSTRIAKIMWWQEVMKEQNLQFLSAWLAACIQKLMQVMLQSTHQVILFKILLGWWVVFIGPAIDSKIKAPGCRNPNVAYSIRRQDNQTPLTNCVMLCCLWVLQLNYQRAGRELGVEGDAFELSYLWALASRHMKLLHPSVPLIHSL